MSDEEWISEVTPLTYDTKSFLDSRVTELRRSDILNIIERAPAKSRIVLYGEAGSGKSTTLSELCNKWKNRIGLTRKFAHAYFIPIRNIVSPYVSLAQIICQDLKMVPRQEEQAVRRFIKFNSRSIIWFLDGFDERTSHGNEVTTIDKLISGLDAPKSTVVVTSRPQDMATLSSIMPNQRLEIFVKGFDDTGVQNYLNKLPQAWAPSYRNLVINSDIPRDLLTSPIIVAMVCYIHQKVNDGSRQGKQDNLKLVSTSSILDAVSGIFLGIKEEKTTGRGLPHYTGYRDEGLSPKMKGVIRTIAKLAFQSIKSGNYNIEIEEFQNDNVFEDDLTNIGILNFAKAKYSFIHPLFQEHAAAHHLARSGADLKQVLALLEQPGLTTTKLGVFSNPLWFAVGLEPTILTSIGYTDKKLSVVRIIHECDSANNSDNLDLELSYQSRLFHECQDSNTREEYLESLTQHCLPTESVALSYHPQIQASAYITLVDALGLDGCLHLLKRVHQEAMIINGGHASLSAPEGCTTRYITDTILISCLPVIDLIKTKRLVIQYCSLHVLAHTVRTWKVVWFAVFQQHKSINIGCIIDLLFEYSPKYINSRKQR